MSAPTSDVLHHSVKSAAAVTQELQRGFQGGGEDAPPTPPPAPSNANVDPRVIRDQIKALSRQRRDQQRSEALTKLRTLHRGYWIAGACVVGATVVFLGARSFLGYQRDTTLALAELRGESTVSTAAPAPVVQDGMPNPLQPLPLSTGAVYVLGANVRTNDKGEAVGFTDLPPLRSTSAMTQLLEGVDLCRAYISLGAVAEVVVTFEPTPGAYPLIDPSAEMCAAAITPATEPTLQPVPTDPIPSTVPAS